jgi:uncharacterized alpha-E superfamily protein
MLSRHAEDLFWIGRYIERAEDTARLLDVTYHSVLEAGTDRTPEDLWGELLETLFLEEDVSIAEAGQQVGALLIADRNYPGSLPSIIARARENARTTREWLSVEVWETLNDLHLHLGRIDLAGLAPNRPYEVLQTVKSSCQAVHGAVDGSMPRGEGYRFLILGQRLERALITSRVMTVWHRRLGGFASSAAYAEWVKLLRSVSAYEAYLRSYRATMEGRRVLTFLLQSADLPRSVLNCLNLIESLLGELDLGAGSSLRRTAGRVRSSVEYVDIDSLGSRLVPFLEDVETGILGLARDIEVNYFRPATATYMHSYEAF